MKAILSVIAGIIFALMFCLYRRRKKVECPECHRRKIVFVKCEIKDEKEIEICKVKNIMTTATGQRGFVMPYSVSNHSYIIPGKRLFFDVTYFCKRCGTEFICPEFTDVEK